MNFTLSFYSALLFIVCGFGVFLCLFVRMPCAYGWYSVLVTALVASTKLSYVEPG